MSAISDVSSTRLYLGNLPRNITKADIEEHFSNHGTGNIKEVKLMNGFGFIEYEDAMDAKDVVPDGSEFKGERLTVQFARGPRRKDDFGGPPERNVPRPRRTIYRMNLTGLAPETSWQDLKDFARNSGQLDVVYSETGRDREGKGYYGFVEFETSADLKSAVEKLDGREFKGATVHCTPDIQDERPDARSYRQRSPPRGRNDDYYDRRGPPPPPRGWSPRGYRERSPGRRPPPPVDDYYGRDGYGRRTPPRGDYGPPPRRYDDPYDARGPPPPPGRGYSDPYARGGDPYARPRSPPRGYGYGGGYGGYEDRRY
ncbi:uncharacterized protein HMPREF1541_03150 [Cyphellophora europaea CBS 101466]|uniref:RRM domain-containing protein n=1 Tax=Cyphellophora europaea (strain CBS 101466) TaxID=1220924 RepID=W2RY08_CYPE1|nr:uncharacterized protein HMPREF1541_03150 [Cyphellophora europaea CBS 101466]ETN41215.1 hypothetical protein HMPREF1541_03150 [Cyphellophora europaea CBS 101466]